jgi:hypothetical protein
MRYDMRMRVDPKNTDQFTECNDSSIRVSKQCLVRKYHSLIILETILFLIWVSISEERKVKSQESIPENTGEDRGVTLLRRQRAHLGVDVCVREVGIGV